MLKSLIEIKKEKSRVFQVLLLDNDRNEDVEVQEAEQVDFEKIERHLADGGSVFITSKSSQKIAPPKDKKPQQNKNKSRKIRAFYFSRV